MAFTEKGINHLQEALQTRVLSHFHFQMADKLLQAAGITGKHGKSGRSLEDGRLIAESNRPAHDLVTTNETSFSSHETIPPLILPLMLPLPSVTVWILALISSASYHMSLAIQANIAF